MQTPLHPVEQLEFPPQRMKEFIKSIKHHEMSIFDGLIVKALRNGRLNPSESLLIEEGSRPSGVAGPRRLSQGIDSKRA